MTSELPLWAAAKPEDPAFLIVPVTDLEKAFRTFHEKNPHIYTRLEKKALELQEAGRSRIGIAELVEDLRYDPEVRSQGGAFKLNNSYRALYARLLVHRRRELVGVIQLRKQSHGNGPSWQRDPDYLKGKRLEE